METLLKILMVEDVPTDAELAQRELRKAGIHHTAVRVDTEREFLRSLENFRPDIILSDHTMPQFDGLAALDLAHEKCPDTPFIFVSGTIGEEVAIESLKRGAVDYILKTNMKRLGPAVRRALQDVAERKQMQAKLEEREAGLRRAQLMAKLAHVITGPDGSFETWSETLPQLIGVASDQVPTSTREWLKLVHPDDRDAFRATSIEAGATGSRVDVDYRIRRADGSEIHVRQAIEPILGQPDEDGEMRWFNTLQDVTEQKRAQDKIERLNRVYAVLGGINSLIVRVRDRQELFREACRIAVDKGKFVLAWIGLVDAEKQSLTPVAWQGCDDEYIKLMPLSLSDSVPENYGLAGRAIAEKKALIANDMVNDPRIIIRKDLLQKHGIRSVVVLPLQVSEEVVGVMALYAELPDFFNGDEMRLLLELAGDISFSLQSIARLEQLEYLSYYDMLTGLPNRTLFLDRLNQQLHARGSEPRVVALVLLDLERFRMVNETLGREGGDELLRQVAVRLERACKGKDNMARVGGDGFGVVVRGAVDAAGIAHIVENQILASLREVFVVNETQLRLAARAGIALFPSDGRDADTLFKNAEATLRTAKKSNERCLFYAADMNARAAQALSLETRLRTAIESQQFVLHYQPKYELAGRGMCGVEALIRWNDPAEPGLVPPVHFIPILEETGMILEVGAWAIRKALADYDQWHVGGLQAPRVAVNVSQIQLRQKNFVDMVSRALSESKAMPNGLDLEITESLIMEDVEENIRKLMAVRDLGINIAIDDFGTGYSSLSYLARLPVNALKIDRSFIITMAKNPDSMTIVSTIIALAHSLKMKVIAEGVETEEQSRFLQLLKCDEMQGYLFSKPLPMEQLTEMLETRGES